MSMLVVSVLVVSVLCLVVSVLVGFARPPVELGLQKCLMSLSWTPGASTKGGSSPLQEGGVNNSGASSKLVYGIFRSSTVAQRSRAAAVLYTIDTRIF